MKTLFLLLLIGSTIGNAQKKYSKSNLQVLSAETLKYYEEAKNCWDNTEDSCIPFYKKMVESATKKNECIACAEIELAMGFYNEYLADSAIFYSNNVLKKSQKQDGKLRWELQYYANQTISASHTILGNPKKAISFMLKCAQLAEQLGDKKLIAITKGNLGVQYINMKNHDKGITYLEEAFEMLQQIRVPRSAGLAANISSAYIDLGKSDLAIIWSRKAIKYGIKENDPLSELAGYYLSASSLEKKNTDSAIYYINKAIPLAVQIGNNQYLATSHNIEGNIHAERGNYKEAKNSFLKSIAFYKKLGNPPGMDAPLKTLGFEAANHKDYKTSSEHLIAYINYSDSVVSKENRQLVHELETQYETEKKEKQIAEQELKIQNQKSNLRYAILGGTLLASILGGIYIYNRKTQKLKLKQLQQEKENAILNSFIQGEERERNRISHELHDGVAAMIGAAKMSLETIPHLPEAKQKEHLSKVVSILENTHADVRHIAHNLLPTVLEQDGIIKATQHFAAEINETKLLNVSVVNNDSNAEQLSQQLQLMLFRVIQELINNIIKHSQAQNATVSFSKGSNELIIEVSDDGIGFEGDIDSGNQGLYSISQRLKSIGGNFKFTQKNDKGMQAIAEVKI